MWNTKCPATFSPPELAVSTAIACDSSQTNQINTDSFNITGCRNAPSSDPHSLFICFYRLIQCSAPSVTWLFVFRHVSGSLTKSSPTFCFDFQSFFWFQLSPAGTVWPVHCQTLPRVYHIAANCFDAGWVAWRRFIRGFQQTTAACWVWKEQGEETAAIRSKGKSRKMLQWFWELRKDTTRIKILLVLILELSIFIMCVYTATVCGACNSLTAAVSCTHWSGISAWGDPPHPHCPKPTSLAGKKNGKKLFFLSGIGAQNDYSWQDCIHFIVSQ